MVLHILSLVDETEMGRMFSTLEIVKVCDQVSNHIVDIMKAHFPNTSVEFSDLYRINTAWQFRFRLLGRIVYEQKANTFPAIIQVIKLTMTAATFADHGELISSDIEHDLNATHVSNICPDTLLDYLLVLLESSIKTLLNKVPDTLNYRTWSRDCIAAARDFVSDLRKISKRIRQAPTRDPDTMLTSLMFEAKTIH